MIGGPLTEPFLTRRAGLRVGAGPRTGAVTLIQRFGSALCLLDLRVTVRTTGCVQQRPRLTSPAGTSSPFNARW